MIAPLCPRLDRWLALLEGSVEADELESLESHLEFCETCLDFVSGESESRVFEAAARGEKSSPDVISIMAKIARDAEAEAIPSRPAVRSRGRRIAPEIPGLTELVEIGRGGSGTVYSALQSDLGRRVALKVLNDAFDESSRARVLREARVLASLRHPNVVTIFETGEADGAPYLVMELVEGGTLQQRLDQGVLSAREAASTVRQLALAVAEAHSLGIVHRDLKPSNILIELSSEPGGAKIPKLADFSMARDDGQGERLTVTGQVMGTPSYMSPEQTGLNPGVGELGPPSDIHGLGAILHACLTGRPPYRGSSSWETLVRVAQGEFEPIRVIRPEVSRDLERIAARCLETQPSRRYHSAFDLAEDLGRYLDGRPVAARPVSPPVRLAKWARRRPALATAALLLVLLAVGAAVGGSYHVIQLGQAVERLKAEQGRTKEARDRSQRALTSLTDDVVQGMLDRGSVLNEKDLAFLRKIRGYYQEPDFDGEVESVESLRFRGKGLLRLARLFHRIGQFEDSKAAYEAMFAVEAKILERQPDDPSAADDRAKAQRTLSLDFFLAGRKAEALALANTIVEQQRPHAAKSVDRQVDFLNSLYHRAVMIAGVGRLEEAELVYEEVSDFATGLRAVKGSDPAFGRAEIAGLYNRGLNLRNLSRLDQAEATFSEALKISEQRAADFPNDLYFLDRVINCLDRITETRLTSGRESEALQVGLRLGEIVRLRGLRFPGDPLQEIKVLDSVLALVPLRKLRSPGDVEAELREAVALGIKRVVSEPAYFAIYESLMSAMNKLGHLLNDTGRDAEAIAVFDRQTELAEPWLKTSQRVQDIRRWMQSSLYDSAITLDRLGRTAEAIPRVERALMFSDEQLTPALRLSLARYLRTSGNLTAARDAAAKAAEGPRQAAAARKLIEEIDSELRQIAAKN